MTAEPIREPDAEEPRAPSQGSPVADPAADADARSGVGAESLIGAVTDSGGVTDAGGAKAIVIDADAAAAAVVDAGSPVLGTAATPSIDPSPIDSDTAATPAVEASAAGAVDPAAAAAVDAAAATPVVVAEAPAAPAKPSRRPVILAWVRRFVTFVLAVALFVTGVAIGTATFQRTRPAPVAVDGPVTDSQPPPAVAQEFITALGNNNADAMRSSLNAQPNKDLTDEFARFGIKKVLSVQTLGTSVDGTRSATEILLKTEKTDGLPFEVNLVILVDGGQIEGFR